ncbi:MAG TPA: ATP-binding protein [Roseovarius sp.]
MLPLPDSLKRADKPLLRAGSRQSRAASRFATRQIVLDASVRDGSAAIIINDDGPGVSEAEIARITERGVRLDSTAQGSGLGLAIAKDILEAYGGRFDLENRDGGGLAAIITLPIASPENAGERG